LSNNGKAEKADVFGRVFRLKPAGDIKQRDAVAWNRAYLAHGVRVAMADERQAALEAAIVAGWIVEPATRYEDVTDPKTNEKSRRHYLGDALVDDMTPAEVSYYGMLCSKLFDEVMSVPKPTSSP